MKFKIDENLPIECVELFRKAGYQADTVNDEKLNGSPDSTIYSVCLDEGRVLVTLDLDFSNIRLYPPNLHKGIIVLRLANQSKSKIINKINQIMPILRQEQLTGCTWIVEENKIRIRSGVNWQRLTKSINTGQQEDNDLAHQYWITLPEGYNVMREFAETVTSSKIRHRLEVLNSSKKVFRRFKDVLEDYPEERDRYYEFLRKYWEEQIIQWLEEEEIDIDMSTDD